MPTLGIPTTKIGVGSLRSLGFRCFRVFLGGGTDGMGISLFDFLLGGDFVDALFGLSAAVVVLWSVTSRLDRRKFIRATRTATIKATFGTGIPRFIFRVFSNARATSW